MQESKKIWTPKKCRNFVLKGVSYIALWKFTKSQDGENFLSVKNFQQQNFEHWRLWKLCNGFCKLWQVTNLILFQQTKKISTFVLKGASYIAFSKFSKSQDGENFPSPRIVKNCQKFSTANFQKISTANFQKFSTANFQKFSTAEFWTQNTVEFCYQQRWQSEAKNFQQQNFEEVTKLWQVTNLTCKLNCATCKLWQRHNFDFISATKKKFQHLCSKVLAI